MPKRGSGSGTDDLLEIHGSPVDANSASGSGVVKQAEAVDLGQEIVDPPGIKKPPPPDRALNERASGDALLMLSVGDIGEALGGHARGIELLPSNAIEHPEVAQRCQQPSGDLGSDRVGPLWQLAGSRE